MSDKIKTYTEAAQEERNYIIGRMSGDIKSMLTPWKRLNKAGIEGLEWGTVNIVAAMSGVGKTALVNELVFKCHELNPTQIISVLFFTIEMASRRLVARMISMEIGMPVKDIYKGDDALRERIETEILPKYRNKDIKYVEKMYSVKKIADIIKAFCSKRLDKQCLIVYDHSLLVRRAPGESERDALVNLGKELLMLKKQFPNSQYIIISQVNRSIEMPERIRNKQLHFPMKSDIFGSDALWHASDVVLFIHDPRRLNIKQYGPKNYPTDGYLFAHLLKVREGRLGMFVIRNQAHVNHFPELSSTDLITNGFKK